MRSADEYIAIAQREEFARQQAIFEERRAAWEAGGRKGGPPPHPVPPHIPGPGNSDLVFVDQMRDNAAETFDEMRELVKTLPLKEQLRLSKLSPHKFQREARRLIRKHEAIRSADNERQLKPNVRRRLEKFRDDVADRIEAVTEKMLAATAGPDPDEFYAPLARALEYQRIAAETVECELCHLQKDPADHDGHGLGECVAVCETCDGAGTVARQGLAFVEGDEQQCWNCHGSGGLPFPEQPKL